MTRPRDDMLTLYKYRALSDEWGRSAASDIILHSRMFWQSPARFNDPFDCSPAWEFGSNARDRKRFIDRAIRNQMSGTTRFSRLSKRTEMRRRPASEYVREAREAFGQWMAESAVTCFSRVNNSILMWAHYAASHSGVCFQFRESLDPLFLAFEVKYERERLAADIAGMRGSEMFERAVLTKAQEWEYEQEMRMLEYRSPPGVRQFPPSALTGVIFGARITDDDRAYIHALIADRAEPLELFDAVVHDTRFQIDIVPR